MISEFYLENFRSYRQATLPLAPLSLLIGANASGKSNALEGLRMLSSMAKGQYLSDVFQGLRRDQAIRGSLDDLTYVGCATFALGCSVDHALPWRDLLVRVKRNDQELVVLEETIDYEGSTFPLYRVDVPASSYSHELGVAYNNFSRGGKKPRITCDDRQAIFTQLTTPARFSTPKAQKQIPETTQAFRRTLERVFFLDPAPRRMRDYSFITDRDLQEDGANLSSVLYDLCERQKQKEQVLAIVKALPEQDIRDIGFLETPRNEVMVTLTESFGGQSGLPVGARPPGPRLSFGGQSQVRDAALLSDGTLRVLAVAAALLSAPQGSLVVIEEIDNGVHPSRAEMLMQNIQQIIEERQIRVLLTTHNPALMDALPLKTIPDVVYCYRDPQEGDSRLVRLHDLPDYPELVAQGTVGYLITRGVLERHFKRPPRSEEEKVAEALDWLKSLKAEVTAP